MFGILLTAISSALGETGTSIGKYEIAHKKESIYAMGFLSLLWGMVFMFITGLVKNDLIFSIASLPTFIARMILELILIFISLNAVHKADRSTFTFLKILTIPLLLIVDLSLGYSVTYLQTVGIIIIFVTLIYLLMNHGLSSKGKLLCLLSGVLAVGTISLYKYNITHFNSVEAEQVIAQFILILALLVTAKIRLGENLFSYLKHKIYIIQSLISGLANIPISFAYLFAPASIITTSSRAMDVLASIISGRAYFKEKHTLIKSISLVFVSIGILLMAF